MVRIGIVVTAAGVLGILVSSFTSAVSFKIASILLTALGLRMLNPRLRKWAGQKPALFLALGGAKCAAGPAPTCLIPVGPLLVLVGSLLGLGLQTASCTSASSSRRSRAPAVSTCW